MQEEGNIALVIIIGTLLFILLASFIIFSLILYQRSRHRHLTEITEMENRFHREKLQAQLEVQEQTQEFIARELHDNIGQILSLAKLQLSTFPANNAEQMEKVKDSKELISAAIDDLRALSHGLNTGHISHQALVVSLRHEMEQLSKAGNIETSLETEGEERPLHPESRVLVYRMCQEILHNIVKHAKAERVNVSLRYLDDAFHLQFRDNGVGFDMEALKDENAGTGLLNLRQRADLLNAELEIRSEPGRGTQVEMIMPYVRSGVKQEQI